MFNNIGSKLKTVAQVVTWIGIIASVIGGIAIMYESPMGFLVIIGGSLISWLSSLAVYGFGQLIENTDILAGRNTSPFPNDNSNNNKNMNGTLDDRISKITYLKNKGLITEEEYKQKMENLK